MSECLTLNTMQTGLMAAEEMKGEVCHTLTAGFHPARLRVTYLLPEVRTPVPLCQAILLLTARHLSSALHTVWTKNKP